MNAPTIPSRQPYALLLSLLAHTLDNLPSTSETTE
jgi:hypothetical protein